MRTVGIVSLKGGVGKTTLAANLGAALVRHEPDGVMLVDFDPRNQLGIHFGLSGDAAGLGQASLRPASWARAVRQVADGVSCLPFGALSHHQVRELESAIARRPELLRDGLGELTQETRRLVVLDTAPESSELLDQVLPLADVLLIVLLADAASFATLPSLEALVRRHPRASAHVLLNGVDGTRLGRDVRAVMAEQLPVPLLPFVIHRDQAVPEALASQRPVLEWAPSSQAADDFRCAAEWVVDALQNRAEPRVAKPQELPVTEASR